MYKLFATDMDHTLLDDNSNFPPNFYERVQNLLSQNKLFALVSGRSYKNIAEKVGDLSKDIIIIGDNGGVVSDKGEILHISKMNENDLKEALNLVKDIPNVSIAAVTHNTSYACICPNKNHELILKEFFNEYISVTDISEIKDDIIKITILDTDNVVFTNTKYVENKLPDSLHSIITGPIWIDIIRKDVHKADGIKKLLERYNLSPDQLVTFGDYLNDITMLKLAGKGYAVSNAHEEVKKVADEIIGYNNEDAVFKKIESLLK